MKKILSEARLRELFPELVELEKKDEASYRQKIAIMSGAMTSDVITPKKEALKKKK